jgi:hypothetical protein
MRINNNNWDVRRRSDFDEEGRFGEEAGAVEDAEDDESA